MLLNYEQTLRIHGLESGNNIYHVVGSKICLHSLDTSNNKNDKDGSTGKSSGKSKENKKDSSAKALHKLESADIELGRSYSGNYLSTFSPSRGFYEVLHIKDDDNLKVIHTG